MLKKTPMNTTTDSSAPRQPARRMHRPHRASYQFPMYRWINWLAVSGYLVGLGVMFFVAPMVGLPPPIVWAFLVAVFCAGVALLGQPRALLAVMMFYFLLMPGNRVLGLLPVPLPGFIDELLFVPIIAVIVMQVIQGHTVKGGNWFPLLFGIVAVLSWYVNGKPSPFTTVKILLVNLKFFIIWYFCRLTLSFKDSKEAFRWCWLYILFAALQFPYNVLWQRGIWLRGNPDWSGGVFGPMAKAAHAIGYLSMIALFLLVGWSVTQIRKCSTGRKTVIFFLAAMILYNLVFMTDTKHVLLLGPVACCTLVFLPGLSVRFKSRIVLLAVFVLLAGNVYVQVTGSMKGYWDVLQRFGTTPKGQMFKAVTVDFGRLVAYPFLGAGPGRFASAEAIENRAPLARRYITPYYDEARRLEYYGRRGTTVISSVSGSVNTDFFFITSEFGWAGEAVYFVFWAYCALSLFAKGIRCRGKNEAWGMCLALSLSLVLFMMLQLLTSISTVACLTFPIWMLVGRIWDMPLAEKNARLPLPAGEAEPGGEAEHAV